MSGPPAGDDRELFGPLERSGAARGWLLVLGVLIVGALLMPSATRASLVPATPAAAVSSTRSTPVGGTVPPVASGTTPTTTSTTPTTVPSNVPASSIRVLVANGTNTNGAASTVGAFLAGKGFALQKPANALTTVSATQVYPIANDIAAADEVAAALGLPSSSVEPNSTPVPVGSTAGANVVVVVGPDILSRTSTSSTSA